MDKIRIQGGRRLSGRIPISGAKNAALPLMCASLLTEDTLTLVNLPHLADISTLATLLAQHGVEIGMDGFASGGHTGKFAAKLQVLRRSPIHMQLDRGEQGGQGETA